MTQIEDNRLESMINQTIHTSVPMAETTPSMFAEKPALARSSVFSIIKQHHCKTTLHFFFLVLHIKKKKKKTFPRLLLLSLRHKSNKSHSFEQC